VGGGGNATEGQWVAAPARVAPGGQTVLVSSPPGGPVGGVGAALAIRYAWRSIPASQLLYRLRHRRVC
jgi:hypothetical protein